MDSQQEVGCCVGCSKDTTDTIECNCTRAVFACGSCCDSDAALRCNTCRDRQRRTAYGCLDFREDPEPGSDVGGRLPVAAVLGAWGPPYRAA